MSSAESSRLVLHNDLAELKRLAAWIEGWARKGVSSDVSFAVQLCLEEAVANVIMYGGTSDARLKIVVNVLAGALHGLHAAHETTGENGKPLGIVHRDVSPQNILVGTDGTSRVLDFGVAKAAGQSHSTGVGQVKGKIRYLSPEQVACGEVDC